MSLENLSFDRDGAFRYAAALGAEGISFLTELAHAVSLTGPGARLVTMPALTALVADGSAMTSIARRHLGTPNRARAVRATLFDKRAGSNWALGWHQHRTIAVAERIQLRGFETWSSKGGIDYVEPPFDLLTRMVTLRAHLDAAPLSNAPLLVALGSYRLGRVASAEAADIAERSTCVACIAEPGDVWAYATPILHASKAAEPPAHRRVLQVDFACEDLPAPLRWLGV